MHWNEKFSVCTWTLTHTVKLFENHANPQCTWCSGCKTSHYHPSMSYHVVNFRQLYPIQQNPKFHEEQDWRMNQHVYQDVKILNINNREHLANMHTQQPMNQFRWNEAIHQNPEIPNMKTWTLIFHFSQIMRSLQLKGRKRVYNIHTKKPITYFMSKHQHPWKSPNSILTHEP